MEIGSSVLALRKHRQKFTRSKTGCLTCRTRRKKCDNLKPVCVPCKRNFLSCSWPDLVQIVNHQQATEDEQEAHSGSCRSVSLYRGSAPQANEEDMSIATWSVNHNAFTSLKKPLKLCVASRCLFQHYVTSTFDLMSIQPLERNMFLTHIVPAATNDDLLMHSLLAVSGAHLNYRDGAPQDIRAAASRHYRLALRGLRHAISSGALEAVGGGSKWLHFSLALVMICHVEAMSGNMEGSAFPHLLALRQVLFKLQSDTSSEVRDMKGFVQEAYAYLALVSNIVPYGVIPERNLPMDTLLTNLSDLRAHKDYGTFFGSGSQLFELIPPVTVFSGKLSKHQTHGPDETLSTETLLEYYSLLSQITYAPAPPYPENLQERWRPAHDAINELYRTALLVWLKSSMCSQPGQTTTLKRAIQDHIDRALPPFYGNGMTPYATIAMWPLIIIGSCMTRKEQQDDLRARLTDNQRYRIEQLAVAARLLDYVWKSEDKSAYGPAGLAFVMKKYGISYCMA